MTRSSKLLERLDAGARHQDYPEAFHLSWAALAADAANEIRRLTAALSEQVAAPKEPTPEMAAAGRKALAVVADRMEEAKLLAVSSIDFWQRVGHEPANEIFKAMLAAAPPPVSPAGEVG